MKEFSVERLFRDARITNIYEGTSQMQIVAASGGAINDIFAEYFNAWDKKEYKGNLSYLLSHIQEIRNIYYDCLKYLKDKKDKSFHEVAAKDIVEIYGSIYISYLLLMEADTDNRKIFTSRRFILDSLAKALKNQASIKSELYTDILHADTILK